MNAQSLEMNGPVDPKMDRMVELVKQYVAAGMPRGKAVAKAMADAGNEVPEMESPDTAAMEQGMQQPGGEMPMPQQSAPVGAPQGGMDTMAMLKQIAMAKRGVK